MVSHTDYTRRQPFWKRHAFFVLGIPFVLMFQIVFGGAILTAIALDEARTTATVTGMGSHGVILYRYDVNGYEYSGSGDPGNPPYPQGSTFQIRYCKAFPPFSTAMPDSVFWGQTFVACLFLLAVDTLVNLPGAKPRPLGLPWNRWPRRP